MTPPMKQDEVLKAVSELIQEVVGDDFDFDEPISMETSFGDDLELESIEFVALAEKMQDRFGDDVDFSGWLSSKELEDIIDLKVGQLVEFILSCQPNQQTA